MTVARWSGLRRLAPLAAAACALVLVAPVSAEAAASSASTSTLSATSTPRPDARRTGSVQRAGQSGAAAATIGVLGQVRTLGATAPWLVPARMISGDNAPDTSLSQADTQVEPSVAADPHAGRYLVAVFQQGRYADGGSVAPGYTHSSDGGRTWHTAMLPGVTAATGGPFDRGSDAVVTFGPDGTVYAQTLVFDSFDCRNGVTVQTSHDHGATFGPPVLVADSSDCYSNSTDKNWITVDTNPASPHFGRVYAVWDEYNYDVSFATLSVPEIERYSDDRGATWSSRVVVASGYNAYPVPLVEPNGNLVIVHNLQDSTGCCVIAVAANISADGGQTFGPTVAVDAVHDTGPVDLRYGGVVSAAVDPVTGALYAAWSDSRFNLNGRDDVLVSTSRDGGLTWSGADQGRPRRDDEPGRPPHPDGCRRRRPPVRDLPRPGRGGRPRRRTDGHHRLARRRPQVRAGLPARTAVDAGVRGDRLHPGTAFPR